MFKVKNEDTRMTWLTLFLCLVKFEYISHSFLVFLMMTFNMYLFPGTDIINSLHNAVFTVNNPSDLTILSPFSLVTRDKVNPLYILFDSRKIRHLILVLFQYSGMSLLIYASETSLWSVKGVDELCLWIAFFRLKLKGHKLQLWIWKKKLSTMYRIVITSISP